MQYINFMTIHIHNPTHVYVCFRRYKLSSVINFETWQNNNLKYMNCCQFLCTRYKQKVARTPLVIFQFDGIFGEIMAGSNLHTMMKKQCSDINVSTSPFYSSAFQLNCYKYREHYSRKSRPREWIFEVVDNNTFKITLFFSKNASPEPKTLQSQQSPCPKLCTVESNGLEIRCSPHQMQTTWV